MATETANGDSRLDRSLRVQCACTLLVAVGAAYISYRHGRVFALRFGADTTTATLWPLVVDGLLTMATVELWKAGHSHRATGQWKAWISFILGVGLSLCANVASAPEPSAFSVVVAACPPLALLLSAELLNQALKRQRIPASTNDTVPATSSAVSSGVHTPTEHLTVVEAVSARCAEGQTGPAKNLDKEGSAAARQSGNVEDDPLCGKAYRLDAEHWNRYQRPISADTLRRHLGIGSQRARALIGHVRQHCQPGIQVSVAAE